MASATRHIIRHGFSGFGPRSALLVMDVVIAYLTERQQFNNMGLEIELFVFDKNDASNAGAGTAWQTLCDATPNSGVTSAVTLPGSTVIPNQDIVAAASDLASAVAQELHDNRAVHEDEMRQRNPAAYALLNQATRIDGSVVTSTACATRGLIGKVQRTNIDKVVNFVGAHVPEIRILFKFEHTIVGADFSSPTQPRLIARRNDSIQPEAYPFDFVHLANGPTAEIPVSSEVRPRTFSSVPNANSIRDFLGKHELLDDKTKLIKRGAKIAIAGMRLSAYDLVPVIMAMTDMIETKAGSWVLNKKRIAGYQGLLTFIGRSDGDPAPPRHAHTMHWPDGESFLTTEEVHAIMLQRDFDWLSLAAPLLTANTAARLGVPPSQIELPTTTKESMLEYHNQNNEYRAGNLTSAGLLRAGQLALIGGFGLESDPDTAEAQLVAKAPLTREGRAGFPTRKSAANDITQARVAIQSPNSEFFAHWKKAWSLDNASPVEIQDLIAQLFGLGVATFVQANFDEIHLQQQNSRVILHDQPFDVLFAPKTMTRSADVLLTSLKGKVKEIVPGVPEYIKGRFLQSLGGEPIHALDVGLGGHGETVSLSYGQTSIVGLQSFDIHNHASAADWAATASRMLVILSAMKAAGDATALQTLIKTYGNNNLPPSRDFHIETAMFEDAWREAQEKACFVRVCTAFSEKERVSDYTHHISSPETRRTCIAFLDLVRPGAQRSYQEELSGIPAFDPIHKRQFYMKRHLDFTPVEMERLWQLILKGNSWLNGIIALRIRTS
ncbi:hypothetical protein SUNI508_13693 [Seiridium unicorne]|uniref:Uncharacterized protein n=1 Tax=Seiridium unicorne TaxID=138068 RepID=A0ABR2VBT4_9PEZI